MKRRISYSVQGVTLLGVLLAGSAARADGEGFAVDHFDQAERGSDWFANSSLDLRGHLRPAVGITYAWGYRSYVLYSPDGEERARVLTDQMFAHLGGTLVLANRLRFGLDVPVVVFQHGDDLGFVPGQKPAPGTPAFGDLRVGGDVRLFGEFGDAATGALGVQAFFPTGSREQLTSDGTLRLLPRIAVAGYLSGFVYSIYGGFHYRPLDEAVLGRVGGSEIVFGAAAGVKVNDVFILGPELLGSTVVTGDEPFRARTTPIELLAGFHVVLADHWRAGSAIGGGLTRGEGAPLMRLLATFEYAQDFCIDKDGDGVCATRDACPELAGVRTRTRLTNGCPLDRDRDGFVDDDDKCPDQPGVKTGDVKTTGCPDRDRDGVPDKLDACPSEAGISTTSDATNGCPAPKVEAAVQGPEVQTSEPIRFVGATAELDPASEPMLAAVAALLGDKPDMHVAIIAHVAGGYPELANQRAAAVKSWLAAHGVDGARLVVEPAKQAVPRAEDSIELRVIEQKEPVGPPLD